jgi:hypothetical protein
LVRDSALLNKSENALEQKQMRFLFTTKLLKEKKKNENVEKQNNDEYWNHFDTMSFNISNGYARSQRG